MKQIIKAVEDYHRKTKAPICIGLDVWVHDSGNLEIEWDLWDGQLNKRHTFNSFAGILEHMNPTEKEVEV